MRRAPVLIVSKRTTNGWTQIFPKPIMFEATFVGTVKIPIGILNEVGGEAEVAAAIVGYVVEAVRVAPVRLPPLAVIAA